MDPDGGGAPPPPLPPDHPAWADLPPEMVQAIGASLPFVARHSVLPLVCKAWRDAAAGPSALWTDVDVSARAEAAASGGGGAGSSGGRGKKGPRRLRGPEVKKWLEARGGQLRRLALRLDVDPTPKAAPPATSDDLSPVAAAAAASPRLADFELDLRGARLVAWPAGEADLGRLTALTALRLDGGDGGARDRVGAPPLPAGLTALASLRHLSATRLGFAALPPVVPALTTLAHLDLSGNGGMACGPAAGGGGLGRLTRLTALLLAGVAPGGPPADALAALPWLQVLDLGADALGSSAALPLPGPGDGAAAPMEEGGGGGGPPDFFIPPLPPGGLPSLTALDLSGRPLGPPSLAALASALSATTALARLSLAGCGPGVGPALPPGLGRHAPTLAALDLSHCGLVTLPDWLGAAGRLAALDVRANPGLVLRAGAAAAAGGEAAAAEEEGDALLGGGRRQPAAPAAPAVSLFGPPPTPAGPVDDVAALAAIAARPGGSLALAKAGDSGWGAGGPPASAGGGQPPSPPPSPSNPSTWPALLALAVAAPHLPASALVATARGRAAVAAAREAAAAAGGGGRGGV